MAIGHQPSHTNFNALLLDFALNELKLDLYAGQTSKSEGILSKRLEKKFKSHFKFNDAVIYRIYSRFCFLNIWKHLQVAKGILCVYYTRFINKKQRG